MKFILSFILFVVVNSCSSPKKSIEFLIGTTDRSDSSGIHFATLDPETGDVSLTGFSKTAPGPGYIALSSDGKAVFAVTADHTINGYLVDEGKLTPINAQPAEGVNPCHVSVHPSGEMAFLANYSDGSFSAYGIDKQKELAPAVYSERYEGRGPDEKRQEQSHAHCSVVSPDGRFVYVADLGTDKVMNYRVDAARKQVIVNPEQPFFSVNPGAGPRHLVVHPEQKWLYLLNELDATITAASVDRNGVLSLIDTYPTLPDDYREPGNTSAAIRLHPNGRFVYVSNRGYDAIHGFRIEDDGRLTRVAEARGNISVPRDFNLDPSGRFLVVANLKTNNLTTWAVDTESGALAYKSTSESVASPSCIVFF